MNPPQTKAKTNGSTSQTRINANANANTNTKTRANNNSASQTKTNTGQHKNMQQRIARLKDDTKEQEMGLLLSKGTLHVLESIANAKDEDGIKVREAMNYLTSKVDEVCKENAVKVHAAMESLFNKHVREGTCPPLFVLKNTFKSAMRDNRCDTNGTDKLLNDAQMEDHFKNYFGLGPTWIEANLRGDNEPSSSSSGGRSRGGNGNSRSSRGGRSAVGDVLLGVLNGCSSILVGHAMFSGSSRSRDIAMGTRYGATGHSATGHRATGHRSPTAW